MKFIRYFTRDNASTPMQWTAEKNASFSDSPVKIPEDLAQKRVLFSSEKNISPSELAPLDAKICQ